MCVCVCVCVCVSSSMYNIYIILWLSCTFEILKTFLFFHFFFVSFISFLSFFSLSFSFIAFPFLYKFFLSLYFPLLFLLFILFFLLPFISVIVDDFTKYFFIKKNTSTHLDGNNLMKVDFLNKPHHFFYRYYFLRPEKNSKKWLLSHNNSHVQPRAIYIPLHQNQCTKSKSIIHHLLLNINICISDGEHHNCFF